MNLRLKGATAYPISNVDREIEVLHRLLKGNRMRTIEKQMKLSSTMISRVRKNVLNQMILFLEI